MTEAERIKLLIEYSGKSARQFAFAIGMQSPQMLYDIKGGKCGISKDLAAKIKEYDPNINSGWILTGEGTMLIDGAANVGEVSGNGNIVEMTVNQTIENAGRDINKYGEKEFMDEIIFQRQHAARQLEVYAASLEKKDDQIDRLIQQNKDQFDRLTSLLEAMQRK